jgi:hypothetical protein
MRPEVGNPLIGLRLLPGLVPSELRRPSVVLRPSCVPLILIQPSSVGYGFVRSGRSWPTTHHTLMTLRSPTNPRHLKRNMSHIHHIAQNDGRNVLE